MSEEKEHDANISNAAWYLFTGMQHASTGRYGGLATNTETVYAAMHETVMTHDERKREEDTQ